MTGLSSLSADLARVSKTSGIANWDRQAIAPGSSDPYADRSAPGGQCLRIENLGHAWHWLIEIDEWREDVPQLFLEANIERVGRGGEVAVALERVRAFD